MQFIDFQDTGISSLIKDYLSQKEQLAPFYNRFPDAENYPLQAAEKLASYAHRETLVQAITQQHKNLELTEKQKFNLDLLAQPNTVTVTTGHQLNLLSGPLYFIYKILHTVKICDALNAENNGYQYVPVFWMATEDHDFEEINHFHTYEKKFAFDAESGGFTGDIDSSQTEDALTTFMEELGDNRFAKSLKEIIQKAYFSQLSLAEATRTLVHELLGEFGILMLDGNSHELKKCMIPYFEQELFSSKSQQLVEETNEKLKDYNNQAFARPINLFYLHENQRERIEKTAQGFILVNSGKQFTADEIKNELHQSPEKFSPNVILRPLYQEVVLPNIAYVGGGGEIAYWLQLKAVFQQAGIPFPMLVLRNSALLIPPAIKHKAEEPGLLSDRMFQPLFKIQNEFAEKNSELFAELYSLENDLKAKFTLLQNIASKTSPVFRQMVEAQQTKQLKGYAKMHQRLLKSEKIRLQEKMDSIESVHTFFFPKGNWQERVINFSEFYRHSGQDLFRLIYEALPPFQSKFVMIETDTPFP